jgi:hypothetical protein
MRRFRQGSTFGPVSPSERRNADLFFADLVGRRGSRSPASREDAELFFGELAGEEIPRSSVPTSIGEADAPEDAPAPTVTPGADKDEIIVTRADGTRFHVRRKVRAKIFTQPGRLRTGWCTDDERVFFRLAWCEGTQGTIDAGANPQGAFKRLLDKVIDQINKRVDLDQIRQTLENASVQAFLEVNITKVGDWKITGDVKLEVNRTGLTSTTAKVSADRGWAKIGVEYKDDGTGKQVMVVVDVPLGKRTISGKECPVRELVVWWDVECLREVPITIPIKPLIDGIEEQEKLFLYFEYAKDILRSDPKIRPSASTDEINEILRSDPKIGTARLNKRQLERLDYLVDQGYWLSSIDGYTSPEGRRRQGRPSDRGPTAKSQGNNSLACDPNRAPAAKFEGNDALSCDRAEKVRKLIVERYGTGVRTLQMRALPRRMRFPPGAQMPSGTGRSERPMLDNRLGRELEGDALDRTLVLGDKKLGVSPFLDENKDELTRMTVEDQQFVTDKSKSIRSRAARLFENLRRVEINLKHFKPARPGSLRTFNLKHEHNCPDDLIEAAERTWGSRIPFTKPDPPLCN